MSAKCDIIQLSGRKDGLLRYVINILKKEKRFNRQTRNEKKSNTKEKIINKRLIRKKKKIYPHTRTYVRRRTSGRVSRKVLSQPSLTRFRVIKKHTKH